MVSALFCHWRKTAMPTGGNVLSNTSDARGDVGRRCLSVKTP